LKKLISVRRALEDPDWLGGLMGGESFKVMRILLIAAMGEPLTSDEVEIFTQVTGRTVTPSAPVEELWTIAGRRSGKTRAIGTIAAYLAACCDHRGILGPGEKGVLPILACNTLQAEQCYNFIRGIFTNIPRFATLVEQLARKMHRLGRISHKVLIFYGIKFATQISAVFASPTGQLNRP
jgi:hypothetical protein